MENKQENEGRLTFCCYPRQLPEYIKEAQEKGYSFFINSGDVTFAEIFPILMRYYIGGDFFIAGTLVSRQVLNVVASEIGTEFWVGDKGYVPGIGSLTIMENGPLLLDLYQEKAEKVRKRLEPFKQKLRFCARRHQINCIAVKKGDEYLVHVGYQVENSIKHENVGSIVTGHPAQLMYEIYSRLARTAKGVNIFEKLEEVKE